MAEDEERYEFKFFATLFREGFKQACPRCEPELLFVHDFTAQIHLLTSRVSLVQRNQACLCRYMDGLHENRQQILELQPLTRVDYTFQSCIQGGNFTCMEI